MKIPKSATKYNFYALISLAVLTSGTVIVPRCFEVIGIYTGRNDPVLIASYRLSRLEDSSYAEAIKNALNQGDFSLARQIIELVDEHQVELSDVLRSQANPDIGRQLSQAVSDSAVGALTGDFETAAGLVGAIASDLTGVGDVRDIVLEGRLAVQGQEYDAVILGLASAGLVLTGGTLLSVGAASPADTGVSVMKNAYKTGQISQPLLKHFRRSTDGLVDVRILRTTFNDIDNMRLSNAKSAIESSIDVGKLNTLSDMAWSVGKVSSNADLSTAVQALHYAENAEHLKTAAKLSSQFGKRTRAVFSLLGPGTLVATGVLMSIFAWSLTGVIWLLALGWVSYRIIKSVFATVR